MSELPVAIVTGAGSGVGSAIARHLAGRGWDIVVNYRSRKADAEAVAADCRAAGASALVQQADIARDAECRLLAEAARDTFGRIDALVNNAGATKFADPNDLEALDGDDFERIFAVNVVGTYQMVRAAAEALKVGGAGSIVNVSSHGAFSGLGSSMAYAASKGALNTLTMSLARSLAPEIRVNAVCPGFVDTDWIRGKYSEQSEVERFRRSVGEITPLGRIASAEDVAEAVGWFVAGGRLVTGQLLVLDGGLHLTIDSPLQSNRVR